MTYMDPTTQPDSELEAILDPEETVPEGFIPRSRVRSLEKKAERYEAAEKDANDAKRELAFLKAGVDVDDPKGALLFRAYDGDLDVAAIQASWAELNPGMGDGLPLEEGGDPVALEVARNVTQQSERAALATSSLPVTLDAQQLPARTEARQAAEEARRQGATTDETMGGFLAKLATAAANGDRSVMVEDRRGGV